MGLNIIEREIARRNEIINNFETKKIELEEIARKFEELKKEIESTNCEQLRKEIVELESYLPQPTEAAGTVNQDEDDE